MDPGRIHQRDPPGHLLRGEQMRLDAPRRRQPVPALQIGPAFGRRRHLDAAHRVEAGGAAVPELPVLLDAVAGQPTHRLRRVGLEDQAGRVRRGAAGSEQRPLVDDQDASRAQGSQVLGDAATDDAGADDHDLPRIVAHDEILFYGGNRRESSSRGNARQQSARESASS